MVRKQDIDLDNAFLYRKFDPEGMLTHIHNFPVLCRQAWRMAMDFHLPPDYAQIKKVVILGMGGSAIGGDLAGSLAANESAVPVLISRDYLLPRYVDEDTLVIASSYSGTTEETLSAFEQAFDTPAKKLAITTGGKLQSLCGSMHVPFFKFDYKCQPRAALPFSFFALLGIFQNLGILMVKQSDLSEAFTNLDNLTASINETVPLDQNPAKDLAQKLADRLVVLYGAGITSEVARRWKGQINENSKSMAYYEVFSELNHNSIVGYANPEEAIRQTIVVMLDSDLLHERIHLRYSITQQLLDQAGIYYQVVNGKGNTALSQMITLVLFGDYVSYYLAMLNEVDPTPVKPINFLKESLANR